MADTQNDEVIIHDSYYYIGHFSKYVAKGAKRIGSSKFGNDVETVAFKNPDGSIVSVVLNQTDRDVKFTFRMCGNQVDCVAEAHSIATYIFS
jgi:glucosylceramidase